MLIIMARHASAPLTEKIEISLSLWILPKYTLMSLSRGFAASAVSLAFYLVYATVAAHNRWAEKAMIPALDVLQSIPVLSFLPTVVLAMIAAFSNAREIGLEIACVVMIFTAQAWNMTFSMYGSIKSVPITPLREAAQVYRLGVSAFQNARTPRQHDRPGLELDDVVCGRLVRVDFGEAFTLKTGIFGSQASDRTWGSDQPVQSCRAGNLDSDSWRGNRDGFDDCGVDQFFWRPIVAWSERFKMEETAESEKPRSWMLDLLHDSRIYQRLQSGMATPRGSPACRRR